MDNKEFSKIMAYVSAAIDKPISTATIEIYYDMLNDLDFALAIAAVKKIIAENEYPVLPTIGKIRKTALELSSPDELNTSEAWGMVINAIRNYGHYQQKEALDSLPPEVAKIVERMGWQELCHSENISVVRGQFVKMYEEEKERDQKLALMPPDVREYIKNKNKSILSLSGGDR